MPPDQAPVGFEPGTNGFHMYPAGRAWALDLNKDEPAAASEGHWQPEVLSKDQPAVPFKISKPESTSESSESVASQAASKKVVQLAYETQARHST